MRLQPDHVKLLCTFVEASRNAVNKEVFMALKPCLGETLGTVQHCGLPDRHIGVYFGDVQEMAELGFLSIRHVAQHQLNFDVSTYGLDVYEDIQAQLTEPAEALDEHMTAYVDTPDFERRNPAAYARWSEASALLWSKRGTERTTDIGHLCREAMQEYASGVIERLGVPNADPNKAHVVARLRAVHKSLKGRASKSTVAFLDSLLVYWGCVSDLVQRQEHGAVKDGDELRWEDGRRVVFHTLMVMYEVDRACALRQ